MRLPLVLFLLLAAPAAAQPDASPDAEVLLRRWAQSVRVGYERVEEVTFAEEVEQVVDSPFARQRLRVVSDVIVRPDVDRPVRDVRRAELNGEPVAPVRVPFLQRRLRRAFPGLALVERAATLPPVRMLGALRPTGRPVPAEIDGQAAWRVEALAPRDDLPLERATLWFARGGEHPTLLRSRVVVRPPRARSDRPVVVTTEYADVDGLPLPRRRRVEATLRQRRRIRTFTVLVTIDAAYSDIEVVRR